LGDVEAQAESSDNPVEALRRLGESVDLLILGTHGSGPRDHLVHRSRAQRLARAPSSPLLVLAPAQGTSSRPRPRDRVAGIGRVAVAVGDRAQGCDAACLGTTIAGATGADVTLVAVDTRLPVPIPSVMGGAQARGSARALLVELRDSMAPSARVMLETDRSV
jgi:hypothetical protein